jgi:hypothetical protein
MVNEKSFVVYTPTSIIKIDRGPASYGLVSDENETH